MGTGNELRATERQVRLKRVGDWQVRLTSYRLGDLFVCVADNVDPGANLARAQGETREAAEQAAFAHATEKLLR